MYGNLLVNINCSCRDIWLHLIEFRYIDTFSTRGGLHGSNNSLNPPKSNAIISTGNSPRESPTPGASAAASLNIQTPVSIPPSSSHSGGKYAD